VSQYDKYDEEWAKLYTQDDLSIYEIAGRYGCSADCVHTHLQNAGVDTSQQSYEDCQDEWARLYTEEKRSVRSIAQEYDCCNQTVFNYLEETGVDVCTATAKHGHDVDDWIALYNQKGWSTAEIAEEYGIENMHVRKILKGCGMDLETDFSKYAEEWAELCRDGWTRQEVAEEYDCHPNTVSKHVLSTGLTFRGKHYDTEEMVRLYKEEDWSVAEIAERQNVTHNCARLRLEKAGVDTSNGWRKPGTLPDTDEGIIRKYADIQTIGCWEWQEHTTEDDYGVLYTNGEYVQAHRLSYRAFNGAIPDGHVVRHRCDNRLCVRPDHLETGTHGQNMSDITRFGENMISLAPAEIIEIAQANNARWTALADAYDVRVAVIRHIRVEK
jgi:predicted DNA-binding protein YlxM (UPF0122 family)